IALLAALAAWPLLFRLGGSTVGSFGMFTGFVRYRLSVRALGPDGAAADVPLFRLAPHMGRDARRIIVPAAAGAFRETHVALLASGLDDLGRLACRTEGAASAIDVRLARWRLDGTALPEARARVDCARPRR